MRQILKKITNVVVLSFILTQVFTFALSFVDTLYDQGMWQQRLIDGIYTARNLTFLLSIGAVLLSFRLTIDDFLLFGSGFFAYLLMRFLFPENMAYFREIQPLMKFIFVGYVSVRANFISLKTMKAGLIWGARIVYCLVMTAFLDSVTLISIGALYMTFSNAVLMAIALMSYSAVVDGKLIDYVGVGTGLFVLLVYGSRGSFLILILLIAYLIWIKFKSVKLILIALFCGFAAAFFGPALLSMAFGYLSNIGYSGRTLEKIASGTLFFSNDRMKIYQYLLTILFKNPIAGIGMCGDRYYLPMRFTGVDATYAHNIILELYLDFGILFGTVIVGYIAYLLRNCFLREKDLERKGLFSVFVFCGIVHLMFSRSWLTEQNFFILFALLLTYSTSRRVHLKVGTNS